MVAGEESKGSMVEGSGRMSGTGPWGGRVWKCLGSESRLFGNGVIRCLSGPNGTGTGGNGCGMVGWTLREGGGVMSVGRKFIGGNNEFGMKREFGEGCGG